MWTPRFLRRNRPVTDPATGLTYVEHKGGADPAQAYRAGRADQRKVDHAPERKKRRRGGLGLLGFLIVALALAGGGYLTLSAREGSFAAGGAAVDRQLAAVTTPARQATVQALDKTGAAVQQTGATIEQQGKALREKVD